MKATIEIKIDVTRFVEENNLTFPDAEKKIQEALEHSELLGEFGFVLKAYDNESVKVSIT